MAYTWFEDNLRDSVLFSHYMDPGVWAVYQAGKSAQ